MATAVKLLDCDTKPALLLKIAPDLNEAEMKDIAAVSRTGRERRVGRKRDTTGSAGQAIRRRWPHCEQHDDRTTRDTQERTQGRG